jgi:branched-chain amino acid transport system substrate-binding protein
MKQTGIFGGYSIIISVLVGIVSAGPIEAADAIKVGAVMATKGIIKEIYLSVNDALKDCFAVANEEGGINGKKIEYLVKETHYEDVDECEKALDQLWSEEHPLIMMGCSTPLAQRVAPKMAGHYKALFCSTSMSGELAQQAMYPSVFVSGPTYGDQVVAFLKYIAKAQPSARVAFFYSDSAWGRDPIRYAKLWTGRLRTNLVNEVVVDLKTPDVQQAALKLKESDPDYVICQGFSTDPIPALIKHCSDLGMRAKFMGAFWSASTEVLRQLGPLANSYLVASPYTFWGSTDAPMVKKIMDYNAHHHPDIVYRDYAYMFGFATGLIFVDVLRSAAKQGKLDYDGLVGALKSMQDVDTGGLTAPLTNVNNRFPQVKIWQGNAQKGDYELAPLPVGLEAWINPAIR